MNGEEGRRGTKRDEEGFECNQRTRLCYDETRGMLCPAMYAALGVNLHLPYWVITAKGGYASGMQVDTRTLEAAAAQALAVAPRSDAALPSSVAPCDS